MARRGKSSPVEDLVDVVAKFPWWAGVASALLSYTLFENLADRPALPPGVRTGEIGSAVIAVALINFAKVGQYLFPALCLLGAGISWYRRRSRRALMTQAKQGKSASVLMDMSWAQFELLVSEYFRGRGYDVQECGGGGPDGGVDLVLRRDGERHLVQCKHWRAYKVGVTTIRELYGVMAAEGVAGGVVVTSGRFTREAQAFAKGRNVQLIDGDQLAACIQQPRSGTTRPLPVPNPQPPSATNRFFAAASTPEPTEPSCPICRRAMVLRSARRGTHAGQSFWGCVGFPACRGIRRLAASQL